MMKSRYLILFLLSLAICGKIEYKSEIIHTNAELGKVCQTSEGDNLILSKVPNKDITFMSKLDDEANYIYHNKSYNLRYTGNAQITQSKLSNGQDGYILYHKLNGKEYFSELTDAGPNQKSKDYSTFSEQASAFTLKNGKIFFTGIANPAANYAQTTINLRVYDPQSQTESAGLSLKAYSKYVSCYEQKDNEVYCVYVYDEDPLRSLLGIQYFKVTDAGIVEKGEPFLIKAFYTQFNYVKAMKYANNEVSIFFQTGNQKYTDTPYGNSGKDLYYYHLEVSPTSMKVIRYDYMSTTCRFSNNAEDYTADMTIFEDNVYIICELENDGKDYAKAFKGYIISKNVKKIEFMDFNRFDGKGVKNPQFVRFEKTLSVLYTHILADDKKNVNLIVMNYPDCQTIDGKVKFYDECPPDKQSKLLHSYINVFLNNPYPSSMQNTKVYFRFVNFNNMKIYNGNTPLELNKDYDPDTVNNLSVQEYNNNGISFLEYIATRKDSVLGDISGKKCKITIEKPDCLDQCKGCDQLGTAQDHHCFDCKPGFYRERKGVDQTQCGFNSSYYNCPRCDVACEECYGPLDYSIPTTNCKFNHCNYEDGYYPYEDDLRTCFNVSDKGRWEQLLKLDQVLFLDKSKSNNPRDWMWRKCHSNCSSCEAVGNDQDHKCLTCKAGLFFYCNQTQKNGIPGSCHKSCENDGCYKSDPKDTEGMEKMCPCLDNCKTCQGPDLCDVCRNTWLLPPERTSCDKSCAHCLIPHYENEATKANGKCMNCKTDFGETLYTFNNKCYKKSEIPYFNYTEYGRPNLTYSVKQLYHVIDNQCNLLTGCKRGCHKCSVLETDRCTECSEDYYEEDAMNKTNRKWFRCFKKDVCLGKDQYPHDPELKVAGVLTVEGDEEKKVCLNCKRNNSFRLPPDMYYCGPKINRTYVDVEEYHALEYCYVRCKECDTWGSSCAMNCLSCRDSKYYDLIKYEKRYGNCFRKQHKCGIYPFYHNYEIAIDEDDCGEDCDVCLYNFQCPKEFPYFKFETHECVEFCPVTDVLGGTCNVNNSIAAIILMRNPFGLRSPYDLLNNTITINQIISSSLFQYFCTSYDCDVISISKGINNYLGNGQIYNLPESKIYIGNNISIELTTVKLEAQKLLDYLKGGDDDPGDGSTDEPPKPKPTALDLSDCEKILKKKYGLPEEEELMIIKADIMKEFNISAILPEFPDVEYQIFSTSLGAFLPLSICKEENTGVTVSNPFNSYDLLNLFQSKTASVVSNGYDVFDANSPFYNDICTPFTNENGNDVLLDARRKDYYNENINLCGEGCAFVGYNAEAKTYTCRCNVRGIPGDDLGEYEGEIIERSMPENFRDLISRRSNIEVFKCASKVFSAQGQKNNIASYILLAGIASFIGVVVFHFVKERSGTKEIYSDIKTVANPPKDEKEEKDKKKDKKDKDKDKKKDKKKEKKPKTEPEPKVSKDKVRGAAPLSTGKNLYGKAAKPKVESIVKDINFEDDNINYAPYKIAKSNDKRTFLQTYWSLLKFKQTIIFTFYTNTIGILRSTKIALFILFVGFYMAFTALFFNDKIMRELYIYKGNPNVAIHVPNIFLSSICSFIAGIIVRFIFLGERDISQVISKDDRKRRKNVLLCNKIKLIVFYAVSGCLLFLCWYYVSAFVSVFKNSQKNYLINTLLSFILCNLWPGITTFIPTFMRRKAIEKGNATLYKVSKYIF